MGDKALPAPPQDVLTTLGCSLVKPSPKPLKTGGFKSVFAARLEKTGEAVVVTVESTLQLSKDAFETHRVEQAVLDRIATEPPHPNFVGVRTKPLERSGRLYMVLERCEQELFDVLIEAGAPKAGVGESVALDYFVQAVAGLRHMHNLGVAHRDIKLENMLLTEAGELKLIDFGLGHVAEVPAESHAPFDMTCDRDLGSRAYTAPEVRAAATLRAAYNTCAADVWSLGVCLFALVTGYWPLKEASPTDWRFKKLREAQARGASSCAIIFGWYKRSTSAFAPELIELLDGMLLVDPEARLTLEHCLRADWLKGAGAAVHKAESLYQNDLSKAREAAVENAKGAEDDAKDADGDGTPSPTSLLDADDLEMICERLRKFDPSQQLLDDVTVDTSSDEDPLYRSFLSGHDCVHYHDDDIVDEEEPSYRSLSAGSMEMTIDDDEEDMLADTEPPIVVRQDAKFA